MQMSLPIHEIVIDIEILLQHQRHDIKINFIKVIFVHIEDNCQFRYMPLAVS